MTELTLISSADRSTRSLVEAALLNEARLLEAGMPHHKHDGREETIVPSPGPTLADVLTEIEPLVQLP